MRSGGTRVLQFKAAAPVTACVTRPVAGSDTPRVRRRFDIRSLSYSLAAFAALGLIGSACNDDESAVCQPKDRTILFSAKIKYGEPSEPFTMPDDNAVFIGVIADADYSVESLWPSVASLTVRPADDVVDAKRTKGFSFEREGQFHRLSIPAGSYRVSSGRGPEIAVVSCSTG